MMQAQDIGTVMNKISVFDCLGKSSSFASHYLQLLHVQGRQVLGEKNHSLRPILVACLAFNENNIFCDV